MHNAFRVSAHAVHQLRRADDLEAGDGRGVDVQRASGGRLPADPAEALDRWAEVPEWGEATAAR